MIGKSEWFSRRKYSGWGLTPRNWKGWVYILIIAAPLIILNYINISDKLRLIITLSWIGIFLLDLLHIMYTLKKDERETKIEAIAERNATYAMVAILTIAIGYEAAKSSLTGHLTINPFIIATLIAGLLAKSITNFYYERRGI